MTVTITKTDDFDQFLKTFSTKGVEKRKEHGCTGSRVFRDPEDPDRVWVFFDWEVEDYERFLADPEVLTTGRELALREPVLRSDSATSICAPRARRSTSSAPTVGRAIPERAGPSSC